MDAKQISLRTMTPVEYRAATDHREAESVRVLSRLVPEDLARERVRRGPARFLPDGLETAGHHLLTAENGSGEAVGNVWVGPDPGGSADSAWLYDLNVFAPFRGRGFGSAILAAVEAVVAGEGLKALGLNVVGDNEVAIALYRRHGYEVMSMVMRKSTGQYGCVAMAELMGELAGDRPGLERDRRELAAAVGLEERESA